MMFEVVFLFDGVEDTNLPQQVTDETNPSARLYSQSLLGHMGETVSLHPSQAANFSKHDESLQISEGPRPQ